jgi:DNA-binding PadR family transcriptional regulator
MSKGSDFGLMELLKSKSAGAEALTALAAKAPAHDPADAAPAADQKLNEVLNRIIQLTGADVRRGEAAQAASAAATPRPANGAEPTAIDNSPQREEFIPLDPPTIRDAGLNDSEVEALILKYLLSRGDSAGREVADQIKMPFILIEPLLRQLKYDQLLVYRGSAPMNDYVYQLTDLGRERARRFMDHCTYFGSAPVSLMDYIIGVKAQSLEKQHPSPEDLKRAFEDILVSERMLRRLGPAINSGRGLFLYGAAGNGKTTIAERITRSFGQFVWIPRAIGKWCSTARPASAKPRCS